MALNGTVYTNSVRVTLWLEIVAFASVSSSAGISLNTSNEGFGERMIRTTADGVV